MVEILGKSKTTADEIFGLELRPTSWLTTLTGKDRTGIRNYSYTRALSYSIRDKRRVKPVSDFLNDVIIVRNNPAVYKESIRRIIGFFFFFEINVD